MATQAILPPPLLRIQDLSHKKVVKFGQFGQTSKLAKSQWGPNLRMGHMWQSRDFCAKQPNLHQFLSEEFLQETFLTKQMRRPHILLILLCLLLSKSTYLLPVSCEIKYSAYIVNSHYISCGEGGNFLSQRHFIPEATSPQRVMIKNKNKADPSSTQWTLSPLLFSRRKYCCTQSAYLTSSQQTEVAIQD